jgi:hypothetical protein
MVFVFINQGLQGIKKNLFFKTQSIVYTLIQCNVITIDTEVNFLEVKHEVVIIYDVFRSIEVNRGPRHRLYP